MTKRGPGPPVPLPVGGLPRQGSRTVHCQDALEWLSGAPDLSGCSVITSLPDVSETPFGLDGWKAWFTRAAATLMDRCPPDGAAIFYQTDIKVDGTWVDKSYLCHRAAEEAHVDLLWHKIVCRREPGTPSFGRPAYSHMLCYSRGIRSRPAAATADVLPRTGTMIWSRAMGIDACLFACRWVLVNTPSRTIVDPFCGAGTVLAIANALGLDAVGVDHSRQRCRRARSFWLHGCVRHDGSDRCAPGGGRHATGVNEAPAATPPPPRPRPSRSPGR